MSRRSKLDPHKDQIAEWVRQGKDTRSIAALLAERGVRVGHVAVANYIKRMMGPTLNKINKRASGKMATLDEALDRFAAAIRKKMRTNRERMEARGTAGKA